MKNGNKTKNEYYLVRDSGGCYVYNKRPKKFNNIYLDLFKTDGYVCDTVNFLNLKIMEYKKLKMLEACKNAIQINN